MAVGGNVETGKFKHQALYIHILSKNLILHLPAHLQLKSKLWPLNYPVSAWSRIQGSKIQLFHNLKGNPIFISGFKRTLRGIQFTETFCQICYYVKYLFPRPGSSVNHSCLRTHHLTNPRICTHLVLSPYKPQDLHTPCAITLQTPGSAHTLCSAVSQFPAPRSPL